VEIVHPEQSLPQDDIVKTSDHNFFHAAAYPDFIQPLRAGFSIKAIVFPGSGLEKV
jgi:hypothetical protein